MVAIVGGNSLGLLNSSMAQLGLQWGGAALGQANERSYVNVANGNLILQRTDDQLIARGLDQRVLRTYNSQAQFDGDNNDGWRMGVYRQVTGLTGTVNMAGSTVTRIDEDGSRSLYTYDVARQCYVSTDGAGAYDTLQYNDGAQQWTWVDGSSRVTEIYDGANDGLIQRAVDLDGHTLHYQFNAARRIQSITDASGGVMTFEYASDRLQSIQLQYRDAANQLRTEFGVSYEYDSRGRLSRVISDLTPASNTDNQRETEGFTNPYLYWTDYRYDGDSTRINHVRQKDGTELTIAYVEVGGEYRVSSVKDGEGRITSYSYPSATETTVTDPLGNVTRYTHDASGQLIKVTDALGHSTQYGYSADGKGNPVRITDALGQVVTMEYDANGNLVRQQDALGNTLERIYGQGNRLEVEVRYVVPDQDGSGSQQPAQPLSTRYVYDSQNHLRYVISAEGHVTRNSYSAGELTATQTFLNSKYDLGGLAATTALTEAQLDAWYGSADKLHSSRTDYRYDQLGQLRLTTTYARVDAQGEGVADVANDTTVRYVRDPAGQLVKTVDGKGQETSISYDGLGRVLATMDADKVVTTTSYDDLGNRTTTQLSNGLWTTSSYNRAGVLVSVAQSQTSGTQLGTTKLSYDAAGRLAMSTDATGRRSWLLYDAAGRKAGEVDADGSLTEYRYNDANQLTRVIRYATLVNTALLVTGEGQPTGVRLDGIRPATQPTDRSAWQIHDAAGRLIKTVDAQGYVSETHYDGASRITGTTRYHNPVSVAGLGDVPGSHQAAPAAHEDDRKTRLYYDADGKLAGTLDAEGYLTVSDYAGTIGQVVRSYAYADKVPTSGLDADPAKWTLADLVAALAPHRDAARDIQKTSFYNLKGQMVGEVDGNGFMTELGYDLAGNVMHRTRYANLANPFSTVLSDMRPAASQADRTTRYSYTATNQLESETAPDGTLTRHTYDAQGKLVSTTVGWQSDDPRTSTRRYDLQGRLAAELSSIGSKQLAAGADVEATWAQYATHYTYDASGRLLTQTGPKDVKTAFYYDTDGRLAATINALGEVEERRYNGLNELERTVRYHKRLGVDSHRAGGNLSLVSSMLNGLADTQKDTVTTYLYDQRGQLQQTTDAEDHTTTLVYNAFGEVGSKVESIDASHSLRREYQYDHRGALIKTLTDPAGIAATERIEYDAFGRVKASHDANGHVTTREYEGQGRVVEIVDALRKRSTTHYNAFEQVLTQTDASGRTTHYAYDVQKRQVVVTLPGGAKLTTLSNRHGQTIESVDGNGAKLNTEYVMDAQGQLETIKRNDEVVSINRYDIDGSLASSTDADDVRTEYSYDAAGRRWTQVVDPTGLKLETVYAYDGQGRAISVTAPDGTVTRTEYDRLGQVKRVIVDARDGGLQLTTQVSYDGRGRKLTVTDPAGNVTTYKYDVLGRRESETTGTVTTRYHYDDAGNVIARVNGADKVTRYVYDANNRLAFEIDAAGGVVATRYDAAGRVIATQGYATTLLLAGTDAANWFTSLDKTQPLLATEVASKLEAFGLANAAKDSLVRQVYDAAGRLSHSLDGAGGLTTYRYDAAGNLIHRISYATPLDLTNLPAEPTAAELNARIKTDHSRDQREHRVYDAAGRLTARATAQKTDAEGNLLCAVETFELDKLGQVTARTRYARYLSTATLVDDQIDSWIQSAVKRTEYATDPQNQVERMGYDSVGRLELKVAADRSATTYLYNRAGKLVAQRAHATLAAAGKPVAPAPSANDRITRLVYDAAGRAVYEINAEGVVSQSFYDAAGNVARTVRYATPVQLAEMELNVSQVAGKLQRNVAEDRVEQHAYDALNRRVYSVDAEGYLKQLDYNGLGHIAHSTRYSQKFVGWGNDISSPLLNADQARALIEPWVAQQAGNPEAARSEHFHYNARGLLESSTDALGYTETYGYDGLGNKTRFTNKNGHTWHYGYDTAGQLTLEQGPPVAVTWLQTVSQGRILTSSDIAVETRIRYDALGNVLARQEAANLPGQSRTTEYQYDAAGRQIKTLYPEVKVYDTTAAIRADDLTRHDVLPAERLSASVVYDALGNAVAAQDVGKAWSYKRYDSNGRLSHEIDALGGVTAYSRNTFGEVIALTRYAKPISLNQVAAGVAVQELVKQLASSEDRTIRTTYDKLGRVLEVVQPEAYGHDRRIAQPDGLMAQVITNQYNAFGDLISLTTGGRYLGSSGTQPIPGSTSRYEYDRRGARIGELRLLDNGTGYLTTTRYDGAGNVAEVLEYANQVSQTGTVAQARSSVATSKNDRKILYTYDAANRKYTETRVGRYSGNQIGFDDAIDSLTTHYYYDAVGNQTGTMDAKGAITATRYDALGRKIAILKPTRENIDTSGKVTPLTELKLDAYGNVVARLDYAGGAKDVTPLPAHNTAGQAVPSGWTIGYADAAFNATTDRRMLFSHDLQGRVLTETDGNGNVTEHSYDAYGHKVKTWTPVETVAGTRAAFTVTEYDALGRVTVTVTPGSITASNTLAANVTAKTTYNSFGELLTQTVDGIVVQQNKYDNAGHLWVTKGSDGIARIQLHDVDGRVTLEATNPNRDLFNAPDYYSDNRVIETRYDALGNAISRTEATPIAVPVKTQAIVGFIKVDQEKIALSPIVANNILFTWPSLSKLGSSDIKIEFDYTDSKGKAVTNSEVLRPGDTRLTNKFESSEARFDYFAEGDIGDITGIRLLKKGITGEWVSLLNLSGLPAKSDADPLGTATQLQPLELTPQSVSNTLWLTSEAPKDPFTQVEVEITRINDKGEKGTPQYVAMTRFGDKVFAAVDVTTLGNFSYEICYVTARENGVTLGRVLTGEKGSYEVSTQVSGLDQKYRPYLDRSVLNDEAVATRLTWTPLPGDEVVSRLRARLEPNGPWVDVFDERVAQNIKNKSIQKLADGRRFIDLSTQGMALGRYQYELLYYKRETLPVSPWEGWHFRPFSLIAHADGRVTMGPKATFGKAIDDQGKEHSNVLTWLPPDRPNARVRLEGRPVDLTGLQDRDGKPLDDDQWEDLTAAIQTFGARQGMALDANGAGGWEYRITFIDPALTGVQDYTEARGLVHIMPSFEAVDPKKPYVFSWEGPKPATVNYDGVERKVKQLFYYTDVKTGQKFGPEDLTDNLLANGKYGFDLSETIALNPTQVYDVSLQWLVDGMAINVDLGTVTSRVHIGPVQPTIIPATATKPGQLTWPLPNDLTGKPLQAKLLVQLVGQTTWEEVPANPDLSSTTLGAISLDDVIPGEYHYKVVYSGYDKADGPLVEWATNLGKAVIMPSAHFGVGTDTYGLGATRALSWRAPDMGVQPYTVTLKTYRTGSPLVGTPPAKQWVAQTIEAAVPSSRGVRQWVDFSHHQEGLYEYVLSFSRMVNGQMVEIGTASGSAHIVPEPALKPGSSSSTLSWVSTATAWPAGGVTQQFLVRQHGTHEYAELDAATWIKTVSDGKGGSQCEIDLSKLDPSAWDYKLVFKQGSTELGDARGTVVSIPPPDAGTVAGFNMPATTLSWMAPPDGFRTVVRLGLGNQQQPYTGPLQTYRNNSGVADVYRSSREGLSLTALPAGEYSYTIEYVLIDTGASYGSVTGKVKVVPETRVEALAGQQVLRWPALTSQSGLSSYLSISRKTGPDAWTPYLTKPPIEQDGAGWDVVNLSSMPPGEYKYTVSYTRNGAAFGQSSGTFETLARATLSKGVLSWPKPTGNVQAVLSWREYTAGATDATPYPNKVATGFDDLPEGQQGLNLSSLINATHYEYRLEYLDGTTSKGYSTGEVRVMPQIKLGEQSPSTLSWETPPAGVSQQMLYRQVGVAEWTVLPDPVPALSTTHSGFDLKNGAAGSYEVRLIYTRNGQVWGETTADVKLVSHPSFGNAGLSMLAWGKPLPGLTQQLQLTGPIGADGAITTKNLTPADLSPGLIGLDLANRAEFGFGNYSYKLVTLQNGKPFAEATGSFRIEATPAMGLDKPTMAAGGEGRYFSWSTPPAGWTQTISVTNEDNSKAFGSLSDGHIPTTAPGLSGYDVSTLPPGRYHYTLTMTPPNGGTPEVTKGHFNVMADPTVISQPGGGGQSGLVTWPAGPGGEKATLYYRNQVIPLTAVDGVYSFDAGLIADGDYPFDIIYRDVDDKDYARVSSTLRTALNGTAIGTGDNLDVLNIPLSIGKANIPNPNPSLGSLTVHRIRFTDTPDLETFRYRAGPNQPWVDHPVKLVQVKVGTKYVTEGYIELQALPSGNYEYELLATKPGASSPYAHATGSFSINHAGEQIALPVTSVDGVYSTRTGQIRWPVPSKSYTNINFYWKLGGDWLASQTLPIRREGNEFVVDAFVAPPGTYDFGILYQNINPTTGHEVWTNATQGKYTVTETTTTNTVYVNEVRTTKHPSVGLPKIEGVAIKNIKDPNLDYYHPFFYVANPAGTSYNYDGINYAYAQAAFTVAGSNIVVTGTYGSDTAGVGLSNVLYAQLPATNTTGQYVLTYYNAANQPIARAQGTYTYANKQGSLVDQTPVYKPSYTTTETVRVPKTTTTTSIDYSMALVTAPHYFIDVVGGTTVAPTLTQTTAAPKAQWRSYSLLGTQDKYFYRGSNTGYENVTSIATGGGVTATNSRYVLQQSAALSTAVTLGAGSYTDIGSSVSLAISHQQVSQPITGAQATGQMLVASQTQAYGISEISKQDHIYNPTSLYENRDNTVISSVPISLPFYAKDMVNLHLKDEGSPAAPLSGLTTYRTFDRWGNTLSESDLRNPAAKSSYEYNADNKVLVRLSPMLEGQQQRSRATYDHQGNTLSMTQDTVDTQGQEVLHPSIKQKNVTRMTYDSHGQLIKQVNADAEVDKDGKVGRDGAEIYHGYDAFGGKTETWTQTGTTTVIDPTESDPKKRERTVGTFAVTRYEYDHNGNLSQITRPQADVAVIGGSPGGYDTQDVDRTTVEYWAAARIEPHQNPLLPLSLQAPKGNFALHADPTQLAIKGTPTVEKMGYDSLGRQTSRTVGLQEEGKGFHSGETTTTQYDLAGRVILSHSQDGLGTRYEYDALGRKTSEYTTAITADQRHIREGIVYKIADTPTHHTKTWGYTDGSSRATTHTMLDGNISRSTYNLAGELIAEDVQTPSGGDAGIHKRYRYDANGRLLALDEYRTQAHADAGNQPFRASSYAYDAVGNKIRERTELTDDNGISQTPQDNYLVYDIHNRLTHVYDSRVTLTHRYDQAGNRIGTSVRYINDSEKHRSIDTHYGFDVMGRVISERTDNNGTLGHTTSMVYDLAGRLASKSFFGMKATQTTVAYAGDSKNGPTTTYGLTFKAVADSQTTETYRYDGQGRLAVVTRDGIEVEQRYYDAQSRLTIQQAPGSLFAAYNQDAHKMLQDLGFRADTNLMAYEAYSTRLSVHNLAKGGKTHTQMTYSYDQLGNLAESWVEHHGHNRYTNRAIGDSFKQVENEADIPSRKGIAKQEYDANGFLIRVTQSYQDAEQNPNRTLLNDAYGRVLQNSYKAQDENKQTRQVREHHLIVNGEDVLRTADSATEDDWNKGGTNGQLSTQPADVRRQSTPVQYSVQAGDTFRSIAQGVWGDASLWYYIAEANGLSGSSQLKEGQVLTLPPADAVGAGSKLSSSTMKPYDANWAVGDTSPNLPPPPKAGGGCGGIGMIIMIVVAVVASIFTAGAAAGFILGTTGNTFALGMAVMSGSSALTAVAGVAVAAVGGAVGSIASQVVGKAIGAVDHFSWKAVGTSALSAGIGAGVGSALQAAGNASPALNGMLEGAQRGNSWAIAAKAAITTTASQGIMSAVGAGSFSWRNVATAAIAAPATQAISSELMGSQMANSGTVGYATATVLKAVAAGTITSVTHKMVNGRGKESLTAIAVNAFGDALGNSIAANMQPRSLMHHKTETELMSEEDLRDQAWSGIRDSWNSSSEQPSHYTPSYYNLAAAGLPFGGDPDGRNRPGLTYAGRMVGSDRLRLTVPEFDPEAVAAARRRSVANTVENGTEGVIAALSNGQISEGKAAALFKEMDELARLAGVSTPSIRRVASEVAAPIQNVVREDVEQPTFAMANGGADLLSDSVFTPENKRVASELVGSLWDHVLNSNMTGFSALSTYDAWQRSSYKATAIANSQRYLSTFDRFVPSQPVFGSYIAENAFNARQELRTATQNMLSPGGKWVSKAIERPRTFESQLIYTAQNAKKNGELITQSEVYRRVVESSGRSNKWVSHINTGTKYLGPLSTAAGAALGGYRVYNAPEGQTARYASQEIGSFAGGVAGGTFGTMAVGAAAVGAAAVGLTIGAPVILVGGILAGVGGSIFASSYGREAGDYYYDLFTGK